MADKGAGSALPALPFVPARLLPLLTAELASLRNAESVLSRPVHGAALFIDVRGYSSLAQALVLSDAAGAAEELTEMLQKLFGSLLMRTLHSHGLEVLGFFGDALLAFAPAERSDEPALGAAALRAAAAGLAIRAAAAGQAGEPLLLHQSVGAGALLACGLRANAEESHFVFAGDAVKQAAEGLALGEGADIVLSPRARALLGSGCRADMLPGGSGHALVSIAAFSPASPLSSPAPPSRPSSPRDAAEGLCGCGAAGAADATGLAPFADVLAGFAPAPLRRGPASLERGHVRVVYCVFACFPELDLAGPLGTSPAAAEPLAQRLGRIARGVHRAAGDFGGCLCKLMVDEKGASALLAFGLPNFAHEDDARRAVRAALALEEWFAISSAPFAAGVAGGRTFAGKIGAPCRHEYGLIGSAVNLAARLMATARDELRAGKGPASAVHCDGSVAAAAGGRHAAELAFDPAGEREFKGWRERVPVFRPREARALRPASASGASASSLSARSGSERRAPPAEQAPAARRPGAACVGRDKELARVLAAVDALCAAGVGRTVIIEAEAGLGKSALVRRAMLTLRSRRAALVVARGSSLEAECALWPMRAVVASACDAGSEAALSSSLSALGLPASRDGPLLWRALFAPAAGSGPAGGAAADGTKTYRARATSEGEGPIPGGFGALSAVADALGRLLRAVHDGRPAGLSPLERRRRPVAVIVEDLQHFDSASWHCLRRIRDAAPSALFLLTTRPMADPPRDFRALAGRDEDETAARRLAALQTGTASRRPSAASGLSGGSGGSRGPASPSTAVVELIRLGPLDDAAARALLERHGELRGVVWAPGAIEAVLRKAGGVPLFLVELCKQQAAGSGTLTAAAAAAGGGALGLVPDSIQQIVLARLDRLPEAAQAVARLAAVIGAGFSRALVRAADPEGRDEAAVEEAFALLARESLIQQQPAARMREAHKAPDKVTVQDLSGEAAGGEEEEEEDEDEKEEGEGRMAPTPDLHYPYEFSSALIQESIYGSLPRPLRQGTHAAVARLLELRAADGAGGLDALVAQHWMAAGETERALPPFERAAAVATGSHALLEVCRLCAAAVSAVEAAGLAGTPLRQAPGLYYERRPGSLPPAPPAAPRRPAGPQAELWHAYRARMLHRWAQAEQGRSNFFRCQEIRLELLLPSLGERFPSDRLAFPLSFKLKIAARLARAFAKPPRPERLPAPGPPATPAEALGLVAVEAWVEASWLELLGGSRPMAGHCVLRGLELATAAPRLAAVHGRAFAHASTAFALIHRWEAARRCWEAAEAVARAIDDDSLRMGLAHQRAWTAVITGRLEEGIAPAEEAARIAAHLSFYMQWEASCVSLGIELNMGRFKAVAERAATLSDLFERNGMRGVYYQAQILSWVAFFTGDDARLGGALRFAAQLHPSDGEAVLWWQQLPLEVLAGLHAWRARGDTREMAARARLCLRLWRPFVDQSRPFLVYSFCCWSSPPLNDRRRRALLDFARAMVAEGEARREWADEIAFDCCWRRVGVRGGGADFEPRRVATHWLAPPAPETLAAIVGDQHAATVRVAPAPEEEAAPPEPEAVTLADARALLAEAAGLLARGARSTRSPLLAALLQFSRAEEAPAGPRRVRALLAAKARFADLRLGLFEALAAAKLARAAPGGPHAAEAARLAAALGWAPRALAPEPAATPRLPFVSWL